MLLNREKALKQRSINELEDSSLKKRKEEGKDAVKRELVHIHAAAPYFEIRWPKDYRDGNGSNLLLRYYLDNGIILKLSEADCRIQQL